MTLIGGEAVPEKGFVAVARHAISVEQQVTEIVLRPIEPLVRGTAIPHRRADEIGIDAPAIFVAAAEHVFSIGASLTGGVAEHREGARGISGEAFAREQHAPEAELRFRDAAGGCCFDPGRAIRARDRRAEVAGVHHRQGGDAPGLRGRKRVHTSAHLRTRLW